MKRLLTAVLALSTIFSMNVDLFATKGRSGKGKKRAVSVPAVQQSEQDQVPVPASVEEDGSDLVVVGQPMVSTALVQVDEDAEQNAPEPVVPVTITVNGHPETVVATAAAWEAVDEMLLASAGSGAFVPYFTGTLRRMNAAFANNDYDTFFNLRGTLLRSLEALQSRFPVIAFAPLMTAIHGWNLETSSFQITVNGVTQAVEMTNGLLEGYQNSFVPPIQLEDQINAMIEAVCQAEATNDQAQFDVTKAELIAALTRIQDDLRVDLANVIVAANAWIIGSTPSFFDTTTGQILMYTGAGLVGVAIVATGAPVAALGAYGVATTGSVIGTNVAVVGTASAGASWLAKKLRSAKKAVRKGGVKKVAKPRR